MPYLLAASWQLQDRIVNNKTSCYHRQIETSRQIMYFSACQQPAGSCRIGQSITNLVVTINRNINECLTCQRPASSCRIGQSILKLVATVDRNIKINNECLTCQQPAGSCRIGQSIPKLASGPFYAHIFYLKFLYFFLMFSYDMFINLCRLCNVITLIIIDILLTMYIIL